MRSINPSSWATMCDEITTLTPLEASVRTKAAASAATGSSPLNGSSSKSTFGDQARLPQSRGVAACLG